MLQLQKRLTTLKRKALYWLLNLLMRFWLRKGILFAFFRSN